LGILINEECSHPSGLRDTGNISVILTDERNIVAKAKVDTHAFAALYDHYFPRIYSYAFYRLNDPCLADDLTSQVFEKAMANLKGYDPGRGSFGAWIFGIARNSINKHLLRQKIRKLVPLESVSHSLFDRSQGVEESFIQDDTLSQAWDLISALDHGQREVLSLKFFSGLSNKEIAQLIGRTESNVGVMLYRTLRQLRSKMEEDDHSEGNDRS
jgi:RNA polymerase sigma factor (sigma-70 family)